jgi:hypothetical protein
MANNNNQRQNRREDTRTEQDKLVDFNVCAAYAKITGDFYNGMLADVGGNKTLLNHPLIARSFRGYKALADQNQYEKDLEEYNNSEDKEGKEAPEPVITSQEQLDSAQRGAEDLRYTADVKTKDYVSGFSQMTVGKAIEKIYRNSFSRQVPNSVSEHMTGFTDNLVGELDRGNPEDEEANPSLESRVIDRSVRHHAIVQGHRKVQEMHLKNDFERMASEYEESTPEESE